MASSRTTGFYFDQMEFLSQLGLAEAT
jgi:hypothetical protein